MKIHEYNEMMAYLTRPGMRTGGRIGFYKGESVVKSHGQQIKELTEAGESSVSIAKKLKLKQQTVNGAMDAMDKGIAGEKFKLNKPRSEIIKLAVNETGVNLKDPKYLEEVIQFIDDNPNLNQKEAAKIIGRKRAELVPASSYGNPGKRWNDEKAKLRNDAEKAWTKRYSNISIEDKTRGDKTFHRHHAGSLREKVGTDNTMFLKAQDNYKNIRPFENAINDIQNKQYQTNLNRNMPIEKKRKIFADLKKQEDALRKKYPEFADYKSTLVFEETPLSKTGYMMKEEMLNPELTISEGKTGQKIKYKNITPSSEIGKKAIELNKNALDKYLINVKAVNTAGNAIEEGIEVCTTGGGAVGKASGGRIGYGKKCYKGQALMDFVRENPEEAMKAFKISKEVNASMAKNPSKWLKAGRWTMRELGPLGLIGGEILFGGAMTMAELSQGKTVWEAMDNGFLYGLAGVEDKTLLEYANRFENITDEEKEYIKKALDISKKAPEYEKILQTMSNMDPSKLTTTEAGARGMGEGIERPTPYARYKTLADKKLADIQAIKGDMTKDQALAGGAILEGLKMVKGKDEEWRRDKIKEGQVRAMESAFDPWSAAEGGRAGFSSGSEPIITIDDKIDEMIAHFQRYLKKGGTMDFKTFSKKYIPENFATGGRAGFDEGSKPKSPGRRTFIKGLGALAVLPIVGKYFKLGPKVLERASTYTGPAIEKIKGMPEWFPGLVKKLWNEGEDVTKKMATGERQVIKRGTLEGGDDVNLIYQTDTGSVSITVNPKKKWGNTESGAYNRDYQLDYYKGQADEMTKGTPPDEFGVVESRPVRTSKDDIELDWSDDLSVDDAMSDLTELEAFAKNKSTKQIHKKKGTKKKDVDPGIDPTDFFPEAEF